MHIEINRRPAVVSDDEVVQPQLRCSRCLVPMAGRSLSGVCSYCYQLTTPQARPRMRRIIRNSGKAERRRRVHMRRRV